MPYTITSRFHQQEGFRNFVHNGIDFAMPEGTPLRSIRDGVIERITNYQGKVNIGKGVLVKWSDGKTAVYGHMSKISEELKVGDRVREGELLGYSGHTGNVVGKTGDHLHFAIKEGNRFIDPSPWVENIQNMNTHVVQHLPEVTPLKVNFFDYMSQHMSSISDLKIHLIHLPYDTLLIQISKQFLQFISVHASFLQNIIACIF